jgi:hypothetical protein
MLIELFHNLNILHVERCGCLLLLFVHAMFDATHLQALYMLPVSFILHLDANLRSDYFHVDPLQFIATDVRTIGAILLVRCFGASLYMASFSIYGSTSTNCDLQLDRSCCQSTTPNTPLAALSWTSA